jgi:hypothetical protein
VIATLWQLVPGGAESTQQIIQDVFKEKKQGSVWLLTFD